MAYQVLARKWRPHTFKEMVGQTHVLQALINALDQNRLHHAYLFTGTRGVGKTTIARIFAKCLNCETGISSQPCGQCAACVQVDSGRYIDLIEVDAASRTRVEDTRELLDNVQYAPASGRYKVYLIDEVHMLSGHSFNALLKTLEEPPPHVIFLLATTDPQKLPATILSRCLQFNLKAMTPDRIVNYLRHVLEQENIGFDDVALWEIAKAAQGSMRDALSLTDQAIAFGKGQVTGDDVNAMLGTVDRGAVMMLVEHLAQGDAAALLQVVTQLAEHSPDYNDILAEMLTLLHRISVVQAVPDYCESEEQDAGLELATIKTLAAKLTAEDVQLFYQIALMGRKDLPLVPDARRGLEMILLRMLLFRPQGAGSSGQSSPKKSSQQTKTVSPAASAQVNASANKPAQADTAKIDSNLLAFAPDSPMVLTTEIEKSVWAALLPQLKLSGAALNLARNCSLEQQRDHDYQFVLDRGHGILLQAAPQARIKEALAAYCGHDISMHISVGQPTQLTPQQLDEQRRAQHQHEAEQSINNARGVQALIKHFDARIEAGSIKPRVTH